MTMKKIGRQAQGQSLVLYIFCPVVTNGRGGGKQYMVRSGPKV